MTSNADTGEAEGMAQAATGPLENPPAVDTEILLEFLYRLGQAYLACGEQTAKVELLLRRVATGYGMRKVRVVAFPTAVFISLHDQTGEKVTLAECESRSLRLDQMADFYALGEAAQAGKLDLREGLEQLAAIRRQKPRFGHLGFVAGSDGLGQLLCEAADRRMGGSPGVRAWSLSAFFRAAKFAPLVASGVAGGLWRATDGDRGRR
jgi:hypothetical protein